MTTSVYDFIYLISIVLFIIGLKRLSSPDTARNGNLVAAAGMGLAIVISLIYPVEGGENNYGWVAGGIVVGSVIGIGAAKKVQMTAMPEMVSLFNGLGGACALLVSLVEFYNYPEGVSLFNGQVFTTLFALFIGSISFTGSLVAYGKLQGFLRDSLTVPYPRFVNAVLLIVVIGLIIYIMQLPAADFNWALILMVVSLVYGITFVTPIGGGDMPVVISLLNSFTGIGAALAGLIYNNQVMLVGGILVGASGTILTILMCQAMNRSLFNVIIGGFSSSGATTADGREQNIKEVSLTDLAIELKYSNKVIVVPGYGLAVAQAQHSVHELEKILEEEGVDFKYAIHPVAGRMPGHMNVLLAEADVPYPKLLELEEANKELTSTDVVLVIGANDVVNPAAKDDASSPIYGMPILEVERAKSIIVLKRSMSAGYAGIQNQLFFGEKTRMLFGDAKASINKLKEEVNQA
ncbi:NAD(P)(+) transhydrogenase (Re/Si-specific) subunit beta [Catalinimonas niigatensis]|uniref:NAD(P)(+) transhydrogenase (Re/Si-specific) subunit beta n=1 Tax=Catalinimonas niigatensis TaxID=1397264 RepID=UPI002664F907|nr:NAD(P)(+) transhydrogenase (Re/Si-specific) subunit beta [Catalinimonas niigatensis]WPP53167.1 NAD(P)(+) transhydrogenase (Re/Si-specific) subunit beta [Catalinimonas niigatensis]